MYHLRKERFPNRRFPKLQPRADGPFRIMKKINDNAYKIELPGDYGVSATFNVADLSPFEEDDEDLRSSPFQPGEDDTKSHGLCIIDMDVGLHGVHGFNYGPRTCSCSLLNGE